MQGFLRFSHWLDRIGYRCGQIANLMILFSCVISASNAMIRYGFDWSNNWLLELQWYLFGAAVMLGASYTFQRNEHVRVDLVYGHVSERKQLSIDVSASSSSSSRPASCSHGCPGIRCSCRRGKSWSNPAIRADSRATRSSWWCRSASRC